MLNSNGQHNEFWCLTVFRTTALAPLIESNDERTSKIEACTLLQNGHARQSVWKFCGDLKQSKLSIIINYFSCSSCNLLFQRHLVSIIHQSLLKGYIVIYMSMPTKYVVDGGTNTICMSTKVWPCVFGGRGHVSIIQALFLNTAKCSCLMNSAYHYLAASHMNACLPTQTVTQSLVRCINPTKAAFPSRPVYLDKHQTGCCTQSQSISPATQPATHKHTQC